MINRLFLILIPLIFLFSSALAGPLDSQEKISMQLEEVELSTVLNMLADQYGLNLIQPGDINEKISLRLNNVKLRDALDAILASNGYNYYLSGDIVVVKPLDMTPLGETVAKIISLDYITPSAAINAVSDLLSPKGKIKVVRSTTANALVKEPVPTKIVIVDLPEVVEMIGAFIKEIDCRQLQVAIKVRLIETNIDDDKRIGFEWPTRLSAKLHGLQSTSSTSTSTGDVSENILQKDFSAGGWTWGKLSVAEVNMALDFLDMQGN